MKSKSEKESKLTRKMVSAWEKLTPEQVQEVMTYGEGYKAFLDKAKTEREAVDYLREQAVRAGFIRLEDLVDHGRKLKPGDRVFVINRGKGMIMAVIGHQPLEKGLNIIGSHLDSPRLDLKPNPLYEAEKLAWLKTHYYGGIKKYHWLTLPLALHGVVFTTKGETVKIVIGDQDTDPVFTVPDLLPHLAKDQMEKKLREAVSGEGLNLLVGSIPVKDENVKERVKEAVLEYLHREYGILEEDFQTAELEAVPAGRSRDVGLDRSLVGGYGQDDRVCAYASWTAIKEVTAPVQTALAVFVDKEETGSAGNTGMKSTFLENTVAELVNLTAPSYNELLVRRALNNSRALSADVNAALDPNYEGVLEKSNAASLGNGVVITKYTGSGGKSSTSDANAEYVNWVRRLFNSRDITWQTAELGAVDKGGGGTIAQFMAFYGMEVVDCGVGLLSMHSPFEVSSKADLIMMHRAYQAFLEQ
ncbi:MAG TPA: aminopeptidase [Bacillota bacterium]|nr:aminopeptidase [Bacillota bacterium]